MVSSGGVGAGLGSTGVGGVGVGSGFGTTGAGGCTGGGGGVISPSPVFGGVTGGTTGSGVGVGFGFGLISVLSPPTIGGLFSSATLPPVVPPHAVKINVKLSNKTAKKILILF